MNPGKTQVEEAMMLLGKPTPKRKEKKKESQKENEKEKKVAYFLGHQTVLEV